MMTVWAVLGGFVLDAADWADKRVLHLVKTVQYTKEATC